MTDAARGMETTSIPDALPRERLLPTEECPQGVLKERPEDFLVEELPLYEPCGEGEHLYLGIQKRHMSHGELLRLLSRHFAVTESAIGAAGMKDRIAITRQTVSVHLPGRAAEGPVGEIDLGTDRATVLWTAWHRNKLRRGHLLGNRFVVRIRRIDPLSAPRIWRGLQRLEREGCPNYFGPQRFGYRGNTHRLGALVLREDWDGVLAELLGARGSSFPEHQREGRVAFDEGRCDDAEAAWGRNDHAERIALRKFARNGDARRAVLSTGDHTRSFWVSALQSAVFNHLLDERLRSGTLASLESGDVAFLHDREAAFVVGDEEPAELAARVEAREISPAGPLWGRKLLEAGGGVAVREIAALERFGLDREIVEASREAPDGARRPYRLFPANVELDAGTDEEGPYVRVAFDLPKGAFATVVMRELIDEQPAEPRPAAHADGRS